MSSAVSMTDPRRPIAGDFLSLLANHELRPFRGEVAGSAPTETQATTVLAFHFRDGVLVAGDRRATAGNVIVADSVDKVVDLDATSVLAVAGVPATAFEMARVLQNSFEYYRRSQLQPLSLPAKVRSVGRLLKENLPMTLQGVGVVVPLFVALDPAMTPPAIVQGPQRVAAPTVGTSLVDHFPKPHDVHAPPRPSDVFPESQGEHADCDAANGEATLAAYVPALHGWG
jgi:hypothetical protein